ncbi:rodlin [Streptomyces justiciae]|uniref:Rodlin n=1 Tax=Streptomyces justiciae TaxID=2780140 RepID=A0ABU3M8B6_9ACTN|nr:rodlin [Streptomyces justiciae]MBE8469690.1 RdlA protein [Streptomyces justiciae]MCW8379993.1 rodlin [Streptomyces justiciae]MDT7847027.1 rodlin [Streptomyces justiciae]
MLKKAMAAAAVAASVVGAASPAMAIGNDGTTSASGNEAHSKFGNSITKGKMSPQATLVQGTANKLCLGVPVKANAQAILGIIAAVGVAQDVPILSAPQNQQCADNSTQAKGDEPVSHILDDISVLAGNGTGNH